jgi:hypothetical protein
MKKSSNKRKRTHGFVGPVLPSDILLPLLSIKVSEVFVPPLDYLHNKKLTAHFTLIIPYEKNSKFKPFDSSIQLFDFHNVLIYPFFEFEILI